MVASGMFKFTWNTAWLDVHGLLMFVILIFGAFLFAGIYFSKQPDATLVRRLKISGVITFAALIGLMISGIVPDIGFGSGAAFSGARTNAYGTFVSHVTDDSLGAFTGPLLFDIMEHVSLIVPGLAAVVLLLVWHYEEQVITVPAIRRSVLWLMGLTGLWMLTIGGIGVYITKILTYPSG